MESMVHTRHNKLFYVKRSLGAILNITLACIFIYSAYTKSGIIFKGFKLYANDNSFDNFQWTFLDFGISSLFATGVIARLMIGLELLLGLFLIFHIFLRSFTYKAIIAVLSLFIVYLFIIIIKQGNTGNCGCFGDQVAMTPLAAIAKNIIMIGIAILLLFIYPIKPFKFQEYICLFIGLIGFSIPFLLNPMYTSTQPVAWGKTINLDPLYDATPAPSIELRKEKHIISFMSLGCSHCKKAAHLLKIIHNEHPRIPIFFVLAGPDALLKKFFDETESTGVPYIYFKNNMAFDTMINAGVEQGTRSGVPAIYWVNNDTIEYKSTYYQLDPKFMEKWIKAAKPINTK